MSETLRQDLLNQQRLASAYTPDGTRHYTSILITCRSSIEGFTQDASHLSLSCAFG